MHAPYRHCQGWTGKAGDQLFSIWKGVYPSNAAMAVMIVRDSAALTAQNYEVLSINMDHGQDHESGDLPPDCFYAKEWSEGHATAVYAWATGYFKIRDDLPISTSGYVKARAWELLYKQNPEPGELPAFPSTRID